MSFLERFRISTFVEVCSTNFIPIATATYCILASIALSCNDFFVTTLALVEPINYLPVVATNLDMIKPYWREHRF